MAKLATKISAASSAPDIAEYLVGSYKSVESDPKARSKEITATSLFSPEFKASAISRASN